MTALYLIEENLDCLKIELRLDYPSVKSSHLTEAIAAACGFKTHAALLAQISKKVKTFVATHFSVEKFFARLEALGHTIKPEFDDAIFHQVPFRAWYPQQSNRRFHEHSRRNLPYICFKDIKRKYCTLDYDHHIPRDVSNGISNFEVKRNEASRMTFEAFKRVARELEMPKLYFSGGVETGWIEKLPIEVGAEFGNKFSLEYFEILNLLYDACDKK